MSRNFAKSYFASDVFVAEHKVRLQFFVKHSNYWNIIVAEQMCAQGREQLVRVKWVNYYVFSL